LNPHLNVDAKASTYLRTKTSKAAAQNPLVSSP